LEEQNLVILNTLLKRIFKALKGRTVYKLRSEYLGHYLLNGHQPNTRKLITHFGVFRYSMFQMIDRQREKTLIPLAKELLLLAQRQYQAESLESGVGLVIHLSFAYTSSEVRQLRGQ
jgi:hypothetical protein